MTMMSASEAVAEFRRRAAAATEIADTFEKAVAGGYELGFMDLAPTMEERIADLGGQLAVAETARLAADARADRFEETAKRRQSEVTALRRVLAGIRRDADPEGLPGEFPADGTVLNIIGWWKPADGRAIIGAGNGSSVYARAAYDSKEAAARQGFLPLWAPAG